MSSRLVPEDMTIRPAGPQDAGRLERLAARDSSRVPAGELLVAESGGRLLAAVSLADGQVIADPLTPTADLVGLLCARRLQLRAAGAEGRAGRARRRARAAGWRSRGTASP